MIELYIHSSEKRSEKITRQKYYVILKLNLNFEFFGKWFKNDVQEIYDKNNYYIYFHYTRPTSWIYISNQNDKYTQF